MPTTVSPSARIGNIIIDIPALLVGLSPRAVLSASTDTTSAGASVGTAVGFCALTGVTLGGASGRATGALGACPAASALVCDDVVVWGAGVSAAGIGPDAAGIECNRVNPCQCGQPSCLLHRLAERATEAAPSFFRIAGLIRRSLNPSTHSEVAHTLSAAAHSTAFEASSCLDDCNSFEERCRSAFTKYSTSSDRRFTSFCKRANSVR